MILYFLHGYVHRDPGITTLLQTHRIYSIPALNIDGFYEIDWIYTSSKKLEMIRKNMNDQNNKNKSCNGVYESSGVDLNRNYGYKFGFDEIGSSGDACDE